MILLFSSVPARFAHHSSPVRTLSTRALRPSATALRTAVLPILPAMALVSMTLAPVALAPVALAADDTAPPIETHASAEAPANEIPKKETDFASRFSFFGSVSFGYGETDGIKYRGVDEDGSADLRNIALQVRSSLGKTDEIVVQLAHEKVGTSPTNDFRNDVELDWLFWAHTFSDGTRLRLGRVPLPIGFYNEVKDIGTALPFYRPSGNFYGEGTWTSDSVDGLALTRDLFEVNGWAVSGDLYYGEWERIETDGNTLTFGEADISDALGFYTWLESPNSRFRLGLGANRFEAEGGVFLAPGATDDEKTRYLSLEAGSEALTFRFEMSRRTFTGGYWQPYYLELVYRVNERFRIAGLYDVGHLRFEIPFFATFDDTIEESRGLSFSYFLRPNVVLKLEQHFMEGYGQIEDRPLNIFFDPPEEVRLTLFSLSATF